MINCGKPASSKHPHSGDIDIMHKMKSTRFQGQRTPSCASQGTGLMSPRGALAPFYASSLIWQHSLNWLPISDQVNVIFIPTLLLGNVTIGDV